MKRRTFLLGALAAPASAAMPALPAIKPVWPAPIPYDGVAGAACQALIDSLHKAINPPILVDNVTGAYLGLMDACRNEHVSLMDAMMKDFTQYGISVNEFTIKP